VLCVPSARHLFGTASLASSALSASAELLVKKAWRSSKVMIRGDSISKSMNCDGGLVLSMVKELGVILYSAVRAWSEREQCKSQLKISSDYTLCLKKVDHFYIDIPKVSMEEAWIKTTTSAEICCRTTVWKESVQLYSFTFILARMICFMSGGMCFVSCICLLIFSSFADIIMTFLQYLFIALLIPFNSTLWR